MADAPEVLYAVEGGVATITLNRPDVLNALNPALLTHLRESLLNAKYDDNVRAVILTGAGRAFCAGADIGGMQGQSNRPRDSEQGLREIYHPLVLTIRNMGKPFVAAVNGSAAGAGMSFALACDVILAGESASFLQAFSKIGLVPDCGSTWFLPRMVGDQRARAMALLAEKIPARDALAYGMVWKVHADDQLMAEAKKTAAYLASMPTQAYGMIKQLFSASANNSFGEQLEAEGAAQSRAMKTADHVEGVTAFREKRAPKFTGK